MPRGPCSRAPRRPEPGCSAEWKYWTWWPRRSSARHGVESAIEQDAAQHEALRFGDQSMGLERMRMRCCEALVAARRNIDMALLQQVLEIGASRVLAVGRRHRADAERCRCRGEAARIGWGTDEQRLFTEPVLRDRKSVV